MTKKAVILICLPMVLVGMLLGFAYTNMVSVQITKSLIDNTPIGNTTPSTGRFTNLTVTGTCTGCGAVTTLPWSSITGTPLVTQWNWQYAGNNGQPSWVWGSNDGFNMLVWNPAQFHVASADTVNGLTNNANGASGRFKMWQSTETLCQTGNTSWTPCTGTIAVPGAPFTGTWYVVCQGGGILNAQTTHPALTAAYPQGSNQVFYQVTNFSANIAQYSFITCQAWGN